MPEPLDIVAVATELAYADLTVGDSDPAMPGYVVDRVFDDQWENSGFYAAAFANDATGDRIVAIRGSQDRLDVIADAELGLNQYLRNRDPVIDYVGAHILGCRITLAGHSLGGCLSQYLGYDCAAAFPGARGNLTIHTHNGLGGVLGLARMNGGFDNGVLEGVAVRNFRHPADPVSRLGGQLSGRVHVLPAEPGSPAHLKYVHSNKRFQPAGGRSVLAQAVESEDEAFGVQRTLLEAGPRVRKALDDLLQDHESFAAARELFQALGAIPAEERSAVLGIAFSLLPLRSMLGALARLGGRRR
jgi:hypothetical protein